MKPYHLLFGLWGFLAPPTQAANSSFATVQFGDITQISLPRNWTYLDNEVAGHLNSSSEAMARIAGVYINQGDNKILVAANAYDTAGKSRATLRLSIRAVQCPKQQDLRKLAEQSSQAIQKTLLPAARETADAMEKLPDIKAYKVLGVKIDYNGKLYCTHATFEGDYGGHVVVADTWICPLGDRALKLSTSYERRAQAIYQPTIDYIWRSLSAK